MTATINEKFKEGDHSQWFNVVDVPQNVLLEQSNDSGEATGFPAIKREDYIFHFGNVPSPNALYRMLAMGTIVVLIQD